MVARGLTATLELAIIFCSVSDPLAGNIRMCWFEANPISVDSDTRVPSDCLLDAVSEMEQSPDVGIMQFSSGVMQVVNTYFENGCVALPQLLLYLLTRATVSLSLPT